MGSVVLLVLIALGILLGYVGVYAKVTKNGYCRARLNAQVRETRVENQRLRADIQMLSSPDRLGRIAMSAGMQFSGDFDYVRPRPTVVVAEAGRD
jgi:cell division protein FtsL